MKLIYNVDAITEPLTGIGRYALHLGQALTKLKDENQHIESIRYFSSNRWITDLSAATKSNEWISRWRQYVPFKFTALKHYHKLRCHHLKQLSANMNDHIFHSPNFILMPFDGHSVATFHDLSFVHYRETQPTYRLKFLDQEIPKTLAQANHIVTPSAFVRNEIITHYNYPASQISVTELGVSDQFRPRKPEDCLHTLQSFGLSYRSFVLSVATNEPRKNLLRLLQAYQSLQKNLRNHFPLVLVGDSGWKNKEVRKIVEQLKRTGDVICTGFVSQQQLHHLYASATITAFPSIYEGFGLPIIESMASGTPVLTSRHSAMEEVASGHAKLVNPNDCDDIKVQLETSLNDDIWRENATLQGLKHAQRYSWPQCATKTVQAYQSINS